MGRLNDPAAGKRGGSSSRRQVITPGPERGLVSIMGDGGLFYANTVGAFGGVSAGQNWGRLSSAAHRSALKLVAAKEASILLFSGDTLFLEENAIYEEPFLVITCPIMIPGFPFSEEKLWVGDDLVWLGFRIDVATRNVEFPK